MKSLSVRGPISGSEVPGNGASAWRPFRRTRGQPIDLGQWARDRYAIAGEHVADVSGSERPASSEQVQ